MIGSNILSIFLLTAKLQTVDIFISEVALLLENKRSINLDYHIHQGLNKQQTIVLYSFMLQRLQPQFDFYK